MRVPMSWEGRGQLYGERPKGLRGGDRPLRRTRRGTMKVFPAVVEEGKKGPLSCWTPR